VVIDVFVYKFAYRKYIFQYANLQEEVLAEICDWKTKPPEALLKIHRYLIYSMDTAHTILQDEGYHSFIERGGSYQ
jgi:hypothetical protein